MNIVRPEHPSPIFRRESWLNLNGKWDFEFDFGASGTDRKMYENGEFSKEIVVPFCPESKLSGIGCTDFMSCVWYRRSFTVPEKMQNMRCLIHFGAVDYKADVYINGALAGTHSGGYTSFEFDITALLKSGENTVVVCATDDTRSGKQPSGKQSVLYHSNGCSYTRTTGIWQTVWLEFMPKTHIDSVKYYPDTENARVLVRAKVSGEGSFTAEVTYDGKKMGSRAVASCGGEVFAEIELAETHLWEVGCGRLYDITLKYGDDVVQSYFGLRTLRICGTKVLINGKSVFQRLVLDQGFYPDGIYTAPTADALVNDINLSMAAGFNGARLHEKIFEPLFLYYCDKLGYIVWGEHANWGYDYTKPENAMIYLSEWHDAVERDFNHPAIVGWCPFNETWDIDGRKQCDDILKAVYLETKALDPTRPCIDTSGNFHVMTDIYDFHDYEQDPAKIREYYDNFYETGVVPDQTYRFCGERQHYGGQPLLASEYGGIRWDAGGAEKDGWGYGKAPEEEQEFIDRYRGLTDAFLDNANIFGFCYTQLYDVEQEINGLYTYERKPKFDMEIFKKINSRKAKIED